ncbi:MAG: DUF4837 family protein [Candidatus Eisenbacteria sp.]|nr:DUF4837 family protein [Candidatus Eisenbacteria bacterium]MCK5597897.1 DUF4837 family protein [Candidatus Eisenbacteria bacterium]
MRRHRGGLARVIVYLLAVAGLLSCSGPVITAVGDSNELVIIHDQGSEKLVELVVDAMEARCSWLLEEPAFKTTLTTLERSGDLKNLRHVLLVGTLDGGAVGEMARKLFPDLREDTPPTISFTEDVWAKRQVVGAVVGADSRAVATFLREHGDRVRADMEEAALARLSTSLRETAVKAGMAQAMSERFGWSVSPPSGYDFYTTDAGDGFVFFRRTRPDRTVFVYWTDGGPGFVSEQFALSRRDEVGTRYLDGDVIEWKRPVEVERVDFLGLPAVRVSGWWSNRTLVGGGPFRTYCFHEPSSERVYLVDVSLFAPGFDKTALMRNLEAIAHTFAAGE